MNSLKKKIVTGLMLSCMFAGFASQSFGMSGKNMISGKAISGAMANGTVAKPVAQVKTLLPLVQNNRILKSLSGYLPKAEFFKSKGFLVSSIIAVTAIAFAYFNRKNIANKFNKTFRTNVSNLKEALENGNFEWAKAILDANKSTKTTDDDAKMYLELAIGKGPKLAKLVFDNLDPDIQDKPYSIISQFKKDEEYVMKLIVLASKSCTKKEEREELLKLVLEKLADRIEIISEKDEKGEQKEKKTFVVLYKGESSLFKALNSIVGGSIKKAGCGQSFSFNDIEYEFDNIKWLQENVRFSKTNCDYHADADIKKFLPMINFFIAFSKTCSEELSDNNFGLIFNYIFYKMGSKNYRDCGLELIEENIFEFLRYLRYNPNCEDKLKICNKITFFIKKYNNFKCLINCDSSMNNYCENIQELLNNETLSIEDFVKIKDFAAKMEMPYLVRFMAGNMGIEKEAQNDGSLRLDLSSIIKDSRIKMSDFIYLMTNGERIDVSSEDEKKFSINAKALVSFPKKGARETLESLSFVKKDSIKFDDTKDGIIEFELL